MKIQVLPVTGTLCQGKEKPQILLTGAFLPSLGFSAGSVVVAKSEADTITLEACGTGIKAYQQVISEVRTKGHTLTEVTHIRKRPRITLSGEWLCGHGFKAGDVIIASFKHSVIKLRRIELCLSENSAIKTKVHKVRLGAERKRRVPYIFFSGHWLYDIGFQSGKYVKVTYQKETLLFETGQKAGKIAGLKNTHHGWPQKIKAHDANCYKGKAVSFLLKGAWLLEEGFQAGDTLIIRYEHERIMLIRLDTQKYGF